jgi:putative peptide zinc metalloprotease protein
MATNSPQTRQLRSDLEFSPQQQQGKTFVVVKDPVTTRYFRFTESQAVILELLRQPIEPSDLTAQASQKLNTAIPVETIETFLKTLEDKWLLDTDEVRGKLANVTSHKIQDRNLLYWKLFSINPEKVFDWLLPRTRWAFTKAFHVFAALTILSGIAISILHWDEFRDGMQGLLNLHGLVFLYIVIFVVVTIHEFSHGLTCRHFGGKVKEVGFMLIYFQPAFYCDVSDSWMFPSKRDRMWVTFAGGYAQLVVWGLSTILWRITDTDTLINQAALVVVFYSGVQTLFNFNPLIKFDGYYFLSDYLEIPNLRAKAFQSLWGWVARKPRSAHPWRDERAKMVYGAASILFSTTLLIYVYSALYTWATTQFAFAGLVGFAMFSSYTLKRTAGESIAGLRAVASRAAFRRGRNIGILAVALLITFVGRWELKVPAEFKVIAHGDMTVRAETEGMVTEVLVHEGSRVNKGDVIARLSDFEKQQQISELMGNLEAKINELALLQAGARPEELDRKQKLVETKGVELANTHRNQELLNQLQQSLERKRLDLQSAQLDLDRARKLAAGGLIAHADLEKAETAVKVREKELAEIEASIRAVSETSEREADLKTRELAEAQSDLKLMKAGSRPEEIRQVQADVAKLNVEIMLLDQEISKTDIKAPISGVVTTPFIERKVGQHLDAGDELGKIIDISHVTVELLVPEKEVADVRYGFPVWMKARSLPSNDFQGRVDYISLVAQTVNNQQMVPVRTELQNDALLLKPDMTGVANIYCGDRRIIDLMSRRLVRWVKTEFWPLLP